jgi:succinate-acetate transporter protein
MENVQDSVESFEGIWSWKTWRAILISASLSFVTVLIITFVAQLLPVSVLALLYTLPVGGILIIYSYYAAGQSMRTIQTFVYTSALTCTGVILLWITWGIVSDTIFSNRSRNIQTWGSMGVGLAVWIIFVFVLVVCFHKIHPLREIIR